jgi:hypothetical protein
MAEKVMKVHPLCQMFGQVAPMPKEDHAQLLEDIRANGVKVPILVNRKKDTILDGLTRWKIAHDLKIKLGPDRFEVFKGKDDEIESEIMSRNLFRRHMTEDQRASMVTKMLRPQLEKEAKERQSAAGSFKGEAKLDGKGSVAEKIAEKAGVSQFKAEQAIKADKAGMTEDVISKKTKLSKAASKAGTKPRKPKKEVPFEDQVYAKWTQWINRFSPPLRQRVRDMVQVWLKTGGKSPEKEKEKAKEKAAKK